MHVSTSFVLSFFALAATAVGQARVGETPRDMTFPEFFNGDGRQKLSEFRGQPVLVVTFADVFGGLAAAGRALKLAEKYESKGLVVIMTRVKAGGTFGDGTEGVDLGAWTMKRYPGANVRVCDRIRPTWDWMKLGMPPYYAVMGADGRVVSLGSMPKKPKGLVEGVEAAMKQLKGGWGSRNEAAARALLYGKRDIGAARTKGKGAIDDEIEAEFQRRLQAIGWLIDDGQWLLAQSSAKELGKASVGVEAWVAAVAELEARFAGEDGQRGLALDKKLQRLLKPFTKKGPGKGADKKLRAFAAKAEGTKVGARAAKLAERVGEAAAIR